MVQNLISNIDHNWVVQIPMILFTTVTQLCGDVEGGTGWYKEVEGGTDSYDIVHNSTGTGAGGTRR